VAALKKMRDEVGKTALVELIQVPHGPGQDPFNIDDMAGQIRWRIKSFGLGTDIPAIDALIQTAENAEYRETAKQLEPLLKAVAELDAKEEKERLEKQRAESALAIAREAAKERALAAAENDSEVVAARERLAGL
jgi:hypothetical protein